MCVFVCMCVYVCMCACVHRYIHTYAQAHCACAYVCVYLFVCVYVCLCVCTHILVHRRECCAIITGDDETCKVSGYERIYR